MPEHPLPPAGVPSQLVRYAKRQYHPIVYGLSGVANTDSQNSIPIIYSAHRAKYPGRLRFFSSWIPAGRPNCLPSETALANPALYDGDFLLLLGSSVRSLDGPVDQLRYPF